MTFLLRAIRLLTLVIWVGGLIFFAFVEAQVAFRIMGTAPPFGSLISGSIGALNQMGQYCGALFTLATLVLASRAATTNRKLLLTQVLVFDERVALLAPRHQDRPLLTSHRFGRAVSSGSRRGRSARGCHARCSGGRSGAAVHW